MKAPYQHKGRFYNYPGETKSVLWRSLQMYIAGWGQRTQGRTALDAWHQEQPLTKTQSLACSANVTITWIGHSTFLIESPQATVLTDPVFGDLTILFKRLQQPGRMLHELPRIDIVIISHNHRDHMDQVALQTIARMFPDCRFYVPQGDKAWLNEWGITRVYEMLWWQQATIPEHAVELTFLPAVHWSQRGLFDYNRSLWGSWMISLAGLQLYFAGDTAYGAHFSAIQKEFSPIDVALMPIGPCEPTVWMKESHISAEDAGRAFFELGAQHFIPMHWGTFGFGVDAPLLPLQRIEAWWQTEAAATACALHTLPMGGSVVFSSCVDTVSESQDTERKGA